MCDSKLRGNQRADRAFTLAGRLEDMLRCTLLYRDTPEIGLLIESMSEKEIHLGKFPERILINGTLAFGDNLLQYNRRHVKGIDFVFNILTAVTLLAARKK